MGCRSWVKICLKFCKCRRNLYTSIVGGTCYEGIWSKWDFLKTHYPNTMYTHTFPWLIKWNKEKKLCTRLHVNGCITHTALAVVGRKFTSLQWRHNGRDGVSNLRCLGCLLNRLFRRRQNNIKAPRHLFLSGEFTGDRRIPLTKGQ